MKVLAVDYIKSVLESTYTYLLMFKQLRGNGKDREG